MLAGDMADTLMDRLADEFVRRYRSGERPTVTEYLKRYPELVDRIRDLFPGLVMLEELAKSNTSVPRYSLLSGIKQPDVLGDYRILQEAGRGGMGIVYEAEQISLGRHVALKILPFQLSSDTAAVERFQREARAAAHLQHPNIVQVYDVGQEDSVWYYAMQFVHGQSLHEVMGEVRRLMDKDQGPADPSTQLTDLAVSLLSRQLAANDRPKLGYESTLPFGTTADSALQRDRQERIREVIDECLQRRRDGEDVAEDSVIEQHADLMPELAKELRMLRLLEASRPPQMVDELVALQAKLRPDGGSVNKDKDIDARTEAEPPRRSVPSLTGCADSKRSSRQRCYHKNVARLAIQVAHGLEYSHQKGLVHRDVKPSNLLLDTLGHIWITDFGLAKPNRGGFTSTGKLVGTLRYMAPEQIEGRCDSRADVYSLGITLFELLTLQPAFSGSGYLDTIDCICHKGPLPPRKLEPSIPRDLETIVLKAIERDADTRYQTAQELADELQKFLDGKPIAAKRRGVAESLLKWIQRNIGTSSLIAALLLLLALSWIALAVVWFQAEKFKKSLNRPLPEPTAVHAADETAKK